MLIRDSLLHLLEMWTLFLHHRHNRQTTLKDFPTMNLQMEAHAQQFMHMTVGVTEN